MHWHRMKKTLQIRYLVEEVRWRGDFDVTQCGFESDVRSSRSCRAWIALDREGVHRFSSGADDGRGELHELGSVGADCLPLALEAAAASNEAAVALVALLDRRDPYSSFDDLRVDMAVTYSC